MCVCVSVGYDLLRNISGRFCVYGNELPVPQKNENFLNRWMTISFQRSLVHGSSWGYHSSSFEATSFQNLLSLKQNKNQHQIRFSLVCDVTIKSLLPETESERQSSVPFWSRHLRVRGPQSATVMHFKTLSVQTSQREREKNSTPLS